MNPQFERWFSSGQAANALAGLGEYFVPDFTYRDEHDSTLAVGELLQWSTDGHSVEAAVAFEAAVVLLLSAGQVKAALGLMRSYAVLRADTGIALSLDERDLASAFRQSATKLYELATTDKSVRSLLGLVAKDFPQFAVEVDLNVPRTGNQ